MLKFRDACYILASCVFFVSCQSVRKVTYEKAEATGLNKYSPDIKYVTDEEGNVRPNKDKRSQFESAASFAGVKDTESAAYDKNSYRKKRWGNNKEFSAKSYSGNKDGSEYQYAPYFAQKQASAQGKNARSSQQDYKVSQYNNTKGAVDRGQTQSKVSDAETDIRRNVYKAPRVLQGDQRSGMTVDDTNAMLGR